ncbi:MAG: 4-alpha-glucanotransferase, partial [Spirochaetales bacterium]
MKFINASKRMTGLALPLLALRTRNGPCGEFPDIASLARLAKYWNMDVVQLLPVNDTGRQTSPYSALSAFALNPVYLRIGSLPELKAGRSSGSSPDRVGEAAAKASEEALKLASDFSDATKVPYLEILERKLAILEPLWEALSAKPEGIGLMTEIEAWSSRNAWAKTYACFVELKRRFDGKAWWEWPDFRTADLAFIEALWRDPAYASGLRLQAWLQMRAEEQFTAACAEARGFGVDVLGDIPILMNADSADVWFDRRIFDTNRAAGAPPDMYSQLGQNWGFPLYHWDEIERRGYSFWKERLASADKFYTMYRIDHVLGFFRIWAIDKHEADGFLGHFVPEFSLSYPELDALGFDTGRIRWLSKSHVPEHVVDEALSEFAGQSGEYLRGRLFARIGNEPLFLFASEVKGGADIAEAIRTAAAIAKKTDETGKAEIPESAILSSIETLLYWWRNRALLETAPGQFVPTWEYRGTTAWQSLSEREKSMLEALVSRRKGESLLLWERTGRKILKAL